MGRKAECDCYACKMTQWRKRRHYTTTILNRLFFEPKPEYIRIKDCPCNLCVRVRRKSRERYISQHPKKPKKPEVLKKYDRLDMIAMDDPEIRRGRI